MGKGPNLIAELGKSPNIDHDKDMAENGAPASATKVTYIIIVVAMVALFALVAIGLHIPTGG
jgi:hypothetical protein